MLGLNFGILFKISLKEETILKFGESLIRILKPIFALLLMTVSIKSSYSSEISTWLMLWMGVGYVFSDNSYYMNRTLKTSAL